MKPSYRSLLNCLRRLNVAVWVSFAGYDADEIRQPILAALKRASDAADRLLLKATTKGKTKR